MQLPRIFALFLMIPSSAMAYAFDSTDDSEGMTLQGEVRSQTEFQVPQASVANNQTIEYRIGPQDLLEIEVFRVDELKRVVRVNSDGSISLPLIGTLNVLDKTPTEVENLIRQSLEKKYMQNPYVTVFIKEYESQKVTINGWVQAPGIFPLKGRTTLIQAISLAKGIKRLGDPTELVIFREKPGVGTTGYRINFREVQAGRVADPLLLKNDIIVVPQNGSKAAFEDTTKTIRTFLGFIPFL